MIFLDANFFLRWLTPPATATDVSRSSTAVALFSRLERGDVEATTSETILAEVAFGLTSKRHYSASVEAAAETLATAIQLPGLKFPPGMKRQYLRALEL